MAATHPAQGLFLCSPCPSRPCRQGRLSPMCFPWAPLWGRGGCKGVRSWGESPSPSPAPAEEAWRLSALQPNLRPQEGAQQSGRHGTRPGHLLGSSSRGGAGPLLRAGQRRERAPSRERAAGILEAPALLSRLYPLETAHLSQGDRPYTLPYPPSQSESGALCASVSPLLLVKGLDHQAPKGPRASWLCDSEP